MRSLLVGLVLVGTAHAATLPYWDGGYYVYPPGHIAGFQRLVDFGTGPRPPTSVTSGGSVWRFYKAPGSLPLCAGAGCTATNGFIGCELAASYNTWPPDQFGEHTPAPGNPNFYTAWLYVTASRIVATNGYNMPVEYFLWVDGAAYQQSYFLLANATANLAEIDYLDGSIQSGHLSAVVDNGNLSLLGVRAWLPYGRGTRYHTALELDADPHQARLTGTYTLRDNALGCAFTYRVIVDPACTPYCS